MKLQKKHRRGGKKADLTAQFEVLWALCKESWNKASVASEAGYLPAKGGLYNCIIIISKRHLVASY